MSGEDLLRHHGDVDAAPGLLDFAVNVRIDRPPAWLRQRLADALDRLGHYPSATDELAARNAVAARHGRGADEVVVLAGAAEGFALLPNLRPRLAALVHPSFTEPDVALRDAGVPVTKVQLDPDDGYRLDPAAIPDEADLVVLGNPTNPTSVLHPAEVVRRIARPGRVVVVDEAFADAVPGEPESLAAEPVPGVLVLRSLTKMWGLPGLRAGYALGDPELLGALVHGRAHWPLNTLTLEAVVACCEPSALAESAEAAREMAEAREALAWELDSLPGVEVHGPAAAPFLLLRVEQGARVRELLRARGVAVRRGDTFPGLGTDHLRVAVRSRDSNIRLVKTMDEVLGGRPGGTGVRE
ncbi:threonine-phosphate decarboxylase [Allosaccharopolyspora coralli]|uniref:Aminotransferase n=1 Tax=Allosaccharopolyspora coralli TaxID=2665642 RepID=A0A5Q3Q414_9PSEU|nr:Rv2231c family pyridoxal phosphate-dependent protein CobC [Allosaccharopolyspora coralli]QGK69361.1 threonine-phosphate decarboxylase [Allosaccharopolyspora coralli]